MDTRLSQAGSSVSRLEGRALCCCAEPSWKSTCRCCVAQVGHRRGKKTAWDQLSGDTTLLSFERLVQCLLKLPSLQLTRRDHGKGPEAGPTAGLTQTSPAAAGSPRAESRKPSGFQYYTAVLS